MEEAVVEATEPRETQLAAAEAPLFRAGVLILAAEYAVRLDDPKRLKEAIDHLAKARQEIDSAPASGSRDLMYGELASAFVLLGGDDDQVDKQIRIRWIQAPDRGARARAEGKVFIVESEIAGIFKQMKHDSKQVPFDVRLNAMRRLTRDLAARGQPNLTAQIVSVAFAEGELAEAKAQVAAEALRATGDVKRARGAAEELVQLASANSTPPSARALYEFLKPIPGATPLESVQPDRPIDEMLRYARVQVALLENKPGEALPIAQMRGGANPEFTRVRSLALIAEWSTDAGVATQAIQAAAEIASQKGNTISDPTLLRLAQQAGRLNQMDMAEVFMKAMAKEDYRAWARAEALRAHLAPATDPKPVDAAATAPIPDNAKDQKVGHALARAIVLRNNVRASTETKTVLPEIDALGLGTFRPFGRAGLALGLQDKAVR